ncbi:hypothetical protein IPA_09370 [Ignicoccus pacificus DSM 13166]|uniref:Uncharacterized protein n=1 Tax=Ignicoccus pacificus DSM 13166 TaxID=940294 RepID=A0A977KC54_9CREN|nr:hypothetical protein IPA_09370 [Ignicoccus pacificus DSM 13166]
MNDEEVIVRCSYIRAPWSRPIVPFTGRFVGGDAEDLGNGYLKLLKLKGIIRLAGKVGDKGKVGNIKFIFQETDVNVIGIKNGIAIVHLVGKGKYKGSIYGYPVEGNSENDELIGVPPIRGRKAKLTIGGLLVLKELPKPSELNEYDIPLPYTVLEIREDCKKLLAFEDLDFVTFKGKLEKLKKGLNEICSRGVVYYKGFVEEPKRCTYLRKGFFISSPIIRFEHKGRYLVLNSSLKSFIVNNGKVDILKDVDVYCKGNETEVMVKDNKALIYHKGVKIQRELPERPTSCEVLNEDVLFAFPSKRVDLPVKVLDSGTNAFIPLFPLVTVVTPIDWEEPWGSSSNAYLMTLTGKKVELEPGSFKLLKINDLIVAYNLYGSIYVFNKDLEMVWSREANAVRSVAVLDDVLAIWTQRPPRLRLFHLRGGRFKEVKKLSFSINHAALCPDLISKLIYAIDEKGKMLALNKEGEVVLESTVTPSWTCMSFDKTLFTASSEGMIKWERLSSVEDWEKLHEVLFSHF